MRCTTFGLKPSFGKKKVVVFDLDGTLTESKARIDANMKILLRKLLKEKKVAVIGGGSYGQFKKQMIGNLRISKNLLKNLFLFPTNSSVMYAYRDRGWKKIYEGKLTLSERQKIIYGFKRAFIDAKFEVPKKTYGKIIEDRGSQVTFSALGQKAPVHAKKEWSEKKDSRPQIIKSLKKHLPEFEIRSGGLTSIDVMRKGIDKAYGIRNIRKFLGVSSRKMVFVGDAFYPGGNDTPVLKTGVDCIRVSGQEETKKLIRFLVRGQFITKTKKTEKPEKSTL